MVYAIAVGMLLMVFFYYDESLAYVDGLPELVVEWTRSRLPKIAK